MLYNLILKTSQNVTKIEKFETIPILFEIVSNFETIFANLCLPKIKLNFTFNHYNIEPSPKICQSILRTTT